MHLEAVIELNSEMHLEAEIKWNSEMHLEAMIERVWRGTGRL
jgi:hypothetical protein